MGTRHIIGWEKNVPCEATFDEGSTHDTLIGITVVLKDYVGNPLTAKRAVHAYFSEDSDGLSVSTSNFTANLTASVGDVLIMEEYHQYMFVCNTSGVFTLAVTYATDAETFYLVLLMPDGKLEVSEGLVFT